MRNKAQEEMIGFALIMIVVAVILVIFLGFYLRSSQKDVVESYEVESFVQATLHYTSDCKNNLGYRSVQNLIFDCFQEETCLSGIESCEVLRITLEGIIEESWKIENRPIKGYELSINSEETEILMISNGNQTGNSRGTAQDFSKGGNSFDVIFTVYG
jgi:hypothetical protein